MRRWAAAAAIIAVLGACGSDTEEADQTVDLFLDQVEAACGEASEQIDELSVDGNGAAVSELADLIEGVQDDLEPLEVPAEVAADYGDFTQSLDELVVELNELAGAVRDGDTAGIETGISNVNVVRTEADKTVRNLVITRCKSLAPADGLASVAAVDPTIVTTPSTDVPITDPVTTDPVTTDPVTTDSIPDSVPESIPDGPIFPEDLSIGGTAPAPAGYEWIDMEEVDVSGLYQKPLVGPLVEYYAGGRVENIDDGHTASIYVLNISEEWTDESRAEYEFWEGVDGGELTETPSGIPVRKKVLAFDETDCIVFTGGSSAITVCTFTGIDGGPILDGWVDSTTAG